MNNNNLQEEQTQSQKRGGWVFDLLLILVLIAGAYFRFAGLDWGEYQYLHPDERFLVWVASSMSPVRCIDPEISIHACPEDQKVYLGLSEYFDTANSTLNPHNVGHTFYVYGTLPLFMARYGTEMFLEQAGWNEITDVGRFLSASVDLLIVLLVYAIASRLYDRRVGLLASAFSGASVMQIQQSHFFTVDNFLNFFTYLGIFFAVLIATRDWGPPQEEPGEFELESDEAPAEADRSQTILSRARALVRHPYFWMSAAFGFALGCAMASKLSAFPLAVMLPAALAIQWFRSPEETRERRFVEAIVLLAVGAAVSLLAFRVFQPYAFSGPGFLGVKPNPAWVANIREQRNQAAGDLDFPPGMQWARRPVTFSGENLVKWGLGLPLGMLAWLGFLWAGWRMVSERGNRRDALARHSLLWGWTAFYFTWQSLQFNPTMRYELPIYPTLQIFAAWGVVALWDKGRSRLAAMQVAGEMPARRPSAPWLFRLGAVLIGGFVLAATYVWAFGFSRIYVRPITRVEASRWIYQNVPGPINLRIQTEDGIYNQIISFPYGLSISESQPFGANFAAHVSGRLERVYIAHAVNQSLEPGITTLRLTIGDSQGETAEALLSADLRPLEDPRGEGYELVLNQPLDLEEDSAYSLYIALESGIGAVTLSGASPANEGDWDDGLPVRLDGYDGYGGIYNPGLAFNMYTDDNMDKLLRFQSILDQADYLFISSSRQWGSLTRIPERFPLTTLYYRELLGCPDDQVIEDCYNVARPGLYQGNLGFELVKIFQSDPSVGPLRINDQPSEEAFTVYDHPKVFVFKKSADYDPRHTEAVLGQVDLTQVVRVTPKKAGSQPANLMLPFERWAQQRMGGTWSRLFNTQSLINSSQFVATLAWYLAIMVLGLIFYPILRAAFPGLADRGYPMARLAGLLVLSYLVWLVGSLGVPFQRSTILAMMGILLLVSAFFTWRQWGELGLELRQRRRDFLLVEGLFLAFFLLDLYIRYANPDLWHPWKGGEKPMDFSYFNAVVKSTSFPPYDPWFAGGYLHYYYFGFVLAAVPVKLLGIVPAVAYNLAIPTLFAMIAMAAFSLAWNLISARGKAEASAPGWGLRVGAGLGGALGMALLGNLGTLRMIYQGYQRLAAPGGVITDANPITGAIWAFQGFIRSLSGASLPYSIGDWYWIPSRAIPAPGDVEPITEFPFFTVLYADLHAHLFALPIALLALAFALSIVLARARWKSWLETLVSFLIGSLAIGALWATNTWDYYPYLALGAIAVGYSIIMYLDDATGEQVNGRASGVYSFLPPAAFKLLTALGGVIWLALLSNILFQPYRHWYALGYSRIRIWEGTHTPMGSYMVHWGLFLFVILVWMFQETRAWLETTPVSALRKLEPYRWMIQIGVVLLLVIIVGLIIGFKVGVAWFVLPLAAWAGVLLLRPGMPDSKRFVLFLIGTGLVLTLMVEAIVLVGDIGRMNTVFKFYLQVWTFLAVSAAAALGWTLRWVPRWRLSVRSAWQAVLIGLIATASLYPIMGGLAKIEDRMDTRAPRTLDGMAFMQYAQYADAWGTMNLAQDYRAIRWLQENVVGSPVIVEANLRNLYHWGSRMTIYTGLPGVVGWEWHQQQQRSVLANNWVSERIAEIDEFYTTTDWEMAGAFLEKYDVRYIILGQQERGHYAGEGLEKFPAADGILWRAVYADADTVIYEVIGTEG